MGTARILALLSLFVALAIIDGAPLRTKQIVRPTTKYYVREKDFDACELRDKIAKFARFKMNSRATTVCEGIVGVQCLVGKWGPNAIKFGICPRAIRCVRNHMIRKVKRTCVNQVQLSNFLGASIPRCVKRCPELKNPEFVMEKIREENSLDLTDLSA